MFIRIILALMLIVAPSQAWAVTQWTKTNMPATGDNLTAWPAAVNAQWSILDTLLSNYRKGYSVTYSSGSTIAVSAGEVVVSNSGGTVRLFLQNAASTNVTFTNIDTGAEASSTTYYLYCGTSTATDAACTFYLSTSSSAPTGVTYYKKLGSIFNNSSSDIDPNKVYTEPAGAPFTDSSGIDTAKYLAVYDYGSSSSSSTRRDPSTLFKVFASPALSGGSVTITNLPFTSASSFTVVCGLDTGAGTQSQAITFTRNSGASVTVTDSQGTSKTVHCIMEGY